MNIPSSNLPAVSGADQGAQLYSAALAKKHQMAEGRAALALIEAAGASAQAKASAPSSTASLGNHINFYV